MSKFLYTVTTQEASVHNDVGVGKFGAKILMFPNHVKAIYKQKAFANDTFRGVPKQQLHRREVAAYRLDRDVLKFGVVPETIVVKRNGREASMQEFKDGVLARDLIPGIFDQKLADWKYRIARLFTMVNVDDLLKIVIFDLVINNCDRHGRNVLFDRLDEKVWAIDNGLAFAPYYKGYRNIFHKYLFLRSLEVPADVLETLKGVTKLDIERAIGAFVGDNEIEHTYLRVQFVIEHAKKLDFHTMSGGKYGRNDFPAHAKWFEDKINPPVDENDGMAHVVDLAKMPGW